MLVGWSSLFCLQKQECKRLGTAAEELRLWGALSSELWTGRLWASRGGSVPTTPTLSQRIRVGRCQIARYLLLISRRFWYDYITPFSILESHCTRNPWFLVAQMPHPDSYLYVFVHFDPLPKMLSPFLPFCSNLLKYTFSPVSNEPLEDRTFVVCAHPCGYQYQKDLTSTLRPHSWSHPHPRKQNKPAPWPISLSSENYVKVTVE